MKRYEGGGGGAGRGGGSGRGGRVSTELILKVKR